MPYRRYSDVPSRPARAVQIFNILVGMAIRRETTTYGGLAKRLGYKGAGVFGQTLGLIMVWCDKNRLPPLTSIVVGQKRGTPGRGLVTPTDLDADRERVYRLDWYGIMPPSKKELE